MAGPGLPKGDHLGVLDAAFNMGGGAQKSAARLSMNRRSSMNRNAQLNMSLSTGGGTKQLQT